MIVSQCSGHTDGKNHTVCDGDASALADQEVAVRLASLAGWDVQDGHLERDFRCRSFTESVEFVNELARISEDLNHHPNLRITDKRQVSVIIWTHQMNCLTKLDFDLAQLISAAYDDLLAVRS